MTNRSASDQWTSNGRQILSDDNLRIIRETLDNEGPIILEHCFYYGSRSPERIVFDDFDIFVEYVQTKSNAGDAFHVWSFPSVCNDANTIAAGKFPDADGRVPEKGAY
ncbi:MAG TPA: hypothetical protein VFZ40_08585 [Pyrinomonadaceae bacterium]